MLFFNFKRGGSLTELGFKGEWTRRRLAEYIAEYGSNSYNWEFGKSRRSIIAACPLNFCLEHGLSQGYAAVLKRVAG